MTAFALQPIRRRLLLTAVAIAGCLVSLGAWRTVRDAEEARILGSFRRRAENQAHLVRERLRLYEEMLHSLHNLFANSDNVTRAEFERAATSLLKRHPGVQALQWVAFVPEEKLAAFSAAAREEYPQFRIFERTPDGQFRDPTPRPFYTVIRLTEPLVGNERALGYDNFTSPVGPALKIAIQERRMVVTEAFRLVQSTGTDEHGIVFVQPVFTAEPTVDEGRLLGFVQGVFRVETMLAQPHRDRPDEALRIFYIDRDAPPQSAELYVNLAGREVFGDSTDARIADADWPTYSQVLRTGGRHWEFYVEMDPEWRARQRSVTPPLVLAGGFITTLIVVVALNLLLRRAEEVERQVALRTAELERTKRALEEDIERRHEAELALQASEERLQAILDYSPAAIFVKDLRGRYLLCNREFLRDSGFTRAEVIGKSDAELFPPEIASVFTTHDRLTLQAGTAQDFEEEHVGPQGPRTNFVQKFPLKDSTGIIYALCGIATDITERKVAARERRELEHRLQEKQKLESLGVLAGGIAHDFNNILTAVLGNASLARALAPRETKIAPHLEQIENAARRAADLCTQMLAYAGKGSLVQARVNLSALVRETTSLLEVSISKNTRLTRNLADALPVVNADATQLRQIVMNLVINAAEAIGDRPGEITLTTTTVEATSEALRNAVQHPELPAGTYVSVEVRDSGGGMSPATLARIFEPFFTTKFSGRGLGLSAVLGIVRSHRGALFVESTPGQGSTFRLLLPAAAKAQEAVSPAPSRSDSAVKEEKLEGTVLVVDDEAHVRVILSRALKLAGLEVLEAEDGNVALQLWRENQDKIRVTILDLTMPNLSGEETLRRMRMQGTQQKVILMSGYSENDATRRCVELGAVAFLPKPFEIDHLLALVKKHL